MHPNTDLTGLCGMLLLLATGLMQSRYVLQLSVMRRLGVLLALLVTVNVPLGGLTLAELVRGITGDLSIPTLLLLAVSLASSAGSVRVLDGAERLRLLKVLALAALLFYPLALGLTPFDPYRLGYGSPWLVLLLAAGAAWSAMAYSTVLAAVLALAAAAWSVNWYESPNLWDYLLDPWLAVYSITVFIKQTWLQRGNKNVQSDAQ